MTVLRWLDRQMDWGWGWWLAVAACCAWIIGSWVKRRMKSRALSEDEPRCARCGYIIMSGAAPVCPECGTDVRRGGLLTPSVLPPPPASPWVALAALLTVPAAAWLTPPVAEWQPFGWEFTVEQVVNLPDVRGQVRWAPPIAIVSAAGNGRYGRRVPREVHVNTYVGAAFGDDPRLLVYPQDMRCLLRYGNSGDPQSGTFTRDVAAEVVRAAGFDPYTDAGRRAVEQLWQHVNRIAAGDFPPTPEAEWVVPLVDRRITYRLRDGARRAVGAAVWACLFSLSLTPVLWWRRRRKRRFVMRQSTLIDGLGLRSPVPGGGG